MSIYVSTDNMGYCKGCNEWSDLRYGFCYWCCVEAEYEAGMITKEEFEAEFKKKLI